LTARRAAGTVATDLFPRRSEDLMPTNPKLDRLLGSYAEFHRHPANVACHKIGIPLVTFNAIAMLGWIAPLGIPLTIPLFVAVIAWYATLDRPLAGIMAAAYALCIVAGSFCPVWLVIATGVVGWIVQFAGHGIWEKRSPAFFTNLAQLLVGPLFVAAVLARRWPNHPRLPG
jgi:uncharacterized membrane protein YGL010W